MRAIATKQPTNDSAKQKKSGDKGRSRSVSPLSTGMPLLQRKCACGGGCPRCKEELGIQTKLKISEPGDKYEQEADRVADEVMRMPEPSVQRQVEPEEEEDEMVQRRAIVNPTPLNSAQSPSEVPPIIHEVLNSPGQSLDPTIRAFMEERFDHDFGNVRVHADTKSAESARATDALAYTVGSDIVFGAGQYALHTTTGRTLLAHELTHVIQRESGDVIRQRPKTQKIKARKRDASLKKLAEQPDDSHREWKRLTSTERMALVIQMANRYGHDFAKNFLWYTQHPIKPVGYHFGPGLLDHPPEWFQEQGYQLWQRSSVNEFWIHPSGSMIVKILDQKRDPRTAKVSQPPVPIREDSAELADATKSILRDTISTETAEMEDLKAQKDQLERMDKTTKNYRRQYDQYIQSLQVMKTRLEATVEDIETLRNQLTEMNSPAVSTVDDQLQGLLNLQIWADIESSAMSTQFLQPLNINIKDLPDDEE